MNPTLSIPLSRLSLDYELRHAQLREYFCDIDALATKVGEHWSLELVWSDDPYRYVDPNLAKGLFWWGNELQYQSIALARKRRGRVLLSLNDTWTLESWSEWLTRGRNTKDIVILHVDDHKDLGSPRIFYSQDCWIDPITGLDLNLLDPKSVASAIMSGALSMGSFMTPFLHYVPEAEVRHLCQAPKCIGTFDTVIKLGKEIDSLLNLNAFRPSISLDPGLNLARGKPSFTRGRYRFTDDLNSWLEGLDSLVSTSDTAFLLHIDMDYFCNRYDGDSDSLENPKPLNPELAEILSRIDMLTRALKRYSLLDRLDDIVIAFSPGFFPAEYWAESCERLLQGLGESQWSKK